MAITTTEFGATAFKYVAGTNLNEVAKKHNVSVDELLIWADREDDSLERSVSPLAVGDVILINNQPPKNVVTETEPIQKEEKEEDIFTEEKVVGAIIGGAAAVAGAKAGAALGGKVGTFFGPIGTGAGLLAGAILGAAIGWVIGDSRD